MFVAMNVLLEPCVFKKMEHLDLCLQACLNGETYRVPEVPFRDIEYLPIQYCTGRLAISSLEGQQKLLHDLANIELQAMELGLRTLIEFSWTPTEFKQQLLKVIREEAKHLKMCLQALDSLGGHWGKWPVHLGLWHATHSKDTLLERLFIVHRYLEGSGLDAGDSMLRRLSGIKNKTVQEVVKVIVDEEIGHVAFGSYWYGHYANEMNLNEPLFLERLLKTLVRRHPRRDKLSLPLRKQAGFKDFEIQAIEEQRKVAHS